MYSFFLVSNIKGIADLIFLCEKNSNQLSLQLLNLALPYLSIYE